MDQKGESDRWVWVFVQTRGGIEQFLGQQEPEQNIAFIPAFPEKETALQGLARLAREGDATYEAQAIRLEDLRDRAALNGFAVFILDGAGRILEKE